jgi:hypothetical protein
MVPFLNDATFETWREFHRFLLGRELPTFDVPPRPQPEAALLVVDPAVPLLTILEAVRARYGLDHGDRVDLAYFNLPHRGVSHPYAVWLDTSCDGLWPIADPPERLLAEQHGRHLTLAEVVLWQVEYAHRTGRKLSTGIPGSLRAVAVALASGLDDDSYPCFEWDDQDVEADGQRYWLWGYVWEQAETHFFAPTLLPPLP